MKRFSVWDKTHNVFICYVYAARFYQGDNNLSFYADETSENPVADFQGFFEVEE
jgi:hypothetical protein